MKVLPGEIYGLLGPNGSGKTTTIKIISAILKPDQGHVNVMGVDPTRDPTIVKNLVGYVPENSYLYESLTTGEFLEFVASVRSLNQKDANERAKALLQAFNVREYLDSPIASLSLGTKQKIAIIAAVIHEPPILLLDEPLNGLDAKSGRILKDLMYYHAERGGTILFSTHIMEVAEQICTRLGIIYGGRIIAEGSLQELRRRSGHSDGSLEEVFLKLTNEQDEVEWITRTLRQALR